MDIMETLADGAPTALPQARIVVWYLKRTVLHKYVAYGDHNVIAARDHVWHIWQIESTFFTTPPTLCVP